MGESGHPRLVYSQCGPVYILRSVNVERRDAMQINTAGRQKVHLQVTQGIKAVEKVLKQSQAFQAVSLRWLLAPLTPTYFHLLQLIWLACTCTYFVFSSPLIVTASTMSMSSIIAIDKQCLRDSFKSLISNSPQPTQTTQTGRSTPTKHY